MQPSGPAAVASVVRRPQPLRWQHEVRAPRVPRGVAREDDEPREPPVLQ